MNINDVMALFEVGMDRTVSGFHPILPEQKVINIGAGKKTLGFICYDLPEWVAGADPLPHGDGTVDHVVAFHFFEHLHFATVIAVLKECQRVLKVNGTVNICVPHAAGMMAYQDLQHQSFYTEDTWDHLFRNPHYDPLAGSEPHEWRFDICFNMIMGLSYKNLALLTQLVRF